MTEEERTREVQRISERSSRSVKVHQEQQRIIRIVHFQSGNLASYVGTLEETTRKAKEMECPYGPIQHIE